MAAEAAVTIATAVPPAVEGVTTATAAATEAGGALSVAATATEVAGVAPEVSVSVGGLEKGLEAAVQEGANPVDVMHQFADETSTNTMVTEDSNTTTVAGEVAPTEDGKESIVDTNGNSKGVDAATTDISTDGQAEKIADPAQKEIDKAVQPQMTKWEESNPPPDQMKEPDKYEAWIKQRGAAEKQFTVNEGVNHDIAQWKKQNSPPDKEKNPEAYEQWEKRRAEKETQSRQQREQLYNQQKNEREEQQRGMSKEEFMKKVARLQELQTLSVELATNIQTLTASQHQTETLKAQLARSHQILNQVNAEITNLRAELQLDAAISKEGWKKVLLPMMLMGVLMLAPMMSSAEQA